MKVSVVVPVFNVELFLKQCVDSLINQTISPYEIILVDDGSKDKSGEICDDYSQRYSNVIALHKKNEGLGFTRNYGMKYATGDYIMFVDSDDYLDNDFLEKINKIFNLTECDTCKTCFRRIDENGNTSTENIVKNETLYNGSDIYTEFLPRLIGSSPNTKDAIPMSSCCTVYSLDIIRNKKISFLSEREWISEDILFNIEYFMNAQKICLSDYIGYNYRITGGSLTTVYKENRYFLSKKMYLREKEVLEKADLYNICRRRLDRQFFIYVRMSIEQLKNSKLSMAERSMEILKICNDKFLLDIIEKYPINQLGIKQKLFIYMIKYKKALILQLLMC